MPRRGGPAGGSVQADRERRKGAVKEIFRAFRYTISSAASFEVRRKVFYHLYKLPQVTIRRQLIIARKDLQMPPGKLAAQCCHASLAFLTDPIGMGRGVEPVTENGEGMTLTCIGFRPLPDETAHQISHKFQLY